MVAFKRWLSPLMLVAMSSASPLLLARQSNDSTVDLSSCPGYKASNVQQTSSGMTADLTLAGTPCNAYGDDLQDLTLTVEYQTDKRLHVIIQDAAQQVYQVPDTVFDRPSSDGSSASSCMLDFNYTENPFSFSVSRSGDNGEVLFDSSAAGLIFESQYVRLRTSLPDSPSLYGLGESTDPFMLNTTNYTRTIWNRDAYGVPPGTNLYGDHPVYFDHRGDAGTHGVFLLNSDGMNVIIDDTDGQYLEYNILGGVLDFYFLAGPTPVEVAQQYSEVVGKSAMMPYWGFGFHQCRYGMRDVYEVASVVYNYSAANIPLETMWTDIDYMYLRRVFTLDPDRFPLEKERSLISYLHEHQQHYIVMVDPAVAWQPDAGTVGHQTYQSGVDAGVFLQRDNGSEYRGVVWPGVTVFPDWFDPATQDYWDDQFAQFFDADTGVDIDALWIDMNEASNFCNYPCSDPVQEAIEMGNPPRPPPVRIGSPIALPGFPDDLQPECHATVMFNVNASTFLGENILVFGQVFTLGSGQIKRAPGLNADNYPIWGEAIDMPADTTISYQYVRQEPDGTFIYEDQNRTLNTGGCGSTQTTNDTITTESPPQSSSKSKRTELRSPSALSKRQSDTGDMVGLPGRDLINPAYMIDNAAGSLSNKTIDTDITHYGGYKEYDTHNLYGAMMSEASRQAMLARRPGLRPMVITRSTFAGSGRQVGHWLGDNLADWEHYLFSVKGILDFAGLFQVPMVGSDVCGFGGVTNVLLCARWATLGAFSPFYRNHETLGSPVHHEFYRWPLVTKAAQNAISIRYRLLDYIYTAMYDQSQDGTPLVQPMFFAYPEDPQTNPLQYQYLYGPGVIIAPVTEENSTTAQIYLPDDVFYDFFTHKTVRGHGEWIEKDVPYDEIQLYYKGGSIIAERAESANTTTELRKKNFSVMIAPGLDGTASGSLYLDDGVSIDQPATSYINFEYKGGKFSITGSFDYDSGVSIERIVVLGSDAANASASTNASAKVVAQQGSIPLTGLYEAML